MITRVRQMFRKRRSGARDVPPVIVPAAGAGAPMPAYEAFTPTEPARRAMLVGREHEIETIVQSLIEDRAHVVLYAERGWGKSSLANVVIETLRRSGITVGRHQCEAGSTFDSMARGLARSLPGSLMSVPVRAEPLEGCEGALPSTPAGPEDVLSLPARLRLRLLICVIDEFDRVADARTRTLLADTIKQLSDRGVALRFMIIGVSGNLEQLLGQHPSIQRNLVAIGLPLLSERDIRTVVEKGAAKAALTFPDDIVAGVAAMSRGMPYIAQLLALRSAQAAARRGASLIDRKDLVASINRMVAETPPRIARLYDELTSNRQDRAMCEALSEIATATQDRWGRMQILERESDEVIIGGRSIAPACWSRLLEAGALRLCEDAPNHVHFFDRTLLYFVLGTVGAQDPVSSAGRPADPDRLGRQLALSTGGGPPRR